MGVLDLCDPCRLAGVNGAGIELSCRMCTAIGLDGAGASGVSFLGSVLFVCSAVSGAKLNW